MSKLHELFHRDLYVYNTVDLIEKLKLLPDLPINDDVGVRLRVLNDPDSEYKSAWICPRGRIQQRIYLSIEEIT